MNPALEQGFCKEILAMLAIHPEGISYDGLKDYIARRAGSKRHFEATFNKSILDVLIHAPFDFRSVGGVNTIVWSSVGATSASAPPGSSAARPALAEGATARPAWVETRRGTPSGPTEAEPANPGQVLRRAVLAELPIGATRSKSAWKQATRARPEVNAMHLNAPQFNLSFDDSVSELLAAGAIEVMASDPPGGDLRFRRLESPDSAVL